MIKSRREENYGMTKNKMVQPHYECKYQGSEEKLEKYENGKKKLETFHPSTH
jgi:hypothetical protein